MKRSSMSLTLLPRSATSPATFRTSARNPSTATVCSRVAFVISVSDWAAESAMAATRSYCRLSTNSCAAKRRASAHSTNPSTIATEPSTTIAS